ncbi:hypothetical protein LCGC14_2651100 [marine sediment metagenome]|uniref:Uncharacterized protein n=1 Tax=marine sediment metagenome TaxID=412755 RepID=A0A0F9C550_9ZZZZ
MAEPTPEEQLADDIGSFHDDPLGYVMYNFPWETERSIQVVELAQGVDDFLTEADLVRKVAYRDRFPNCRYGPDLWACDFLDSLVGKSGNASSMAVLR